MMRATTPQPPSYQQHVPTANHTLTKSPKAAVDEQPYEEANGTTLRRRGSLGFLRRSKSRERSASVGSTPARKLSKREVKRMREEEARRKEALLARPPRIPAVPSQPELQTFGGEGAKGNGAYIMSNRSVGNYSQRLAHKTSQESIGSEFYRGMPIPPVPPVPPIPGTALTKDGGDMPRPPSMAHRGRYSYASTSVSTINSPRRIRRRKDPTPFNILVIGARSSGKTSFLKFLQSSLALPPSKQRSTTNDDFDMPPPPSAAAFPHFTSQYVETEIDHERVGVTLWDSEGFEQNVADLQLREVTSFIESKFEDTFTEESKVARAPGIRDTHIHCVFMLLDPARLDATITADQKAKTANGVRARANSFSRVKARALPLTGLDESLDLNVLRALKGKTTTVPIISKADTVTKAHMAHLKQAVYASLKENGLDTFEALEVGAESDDEDDDDDVSDTSTEHGQPPVEGINGVKAALDNKENNAQADPDKFSMTSHLESSSDSGDSQAVQNKTDAPLTNGHTVPSSSPPAQPTKTAPTPPAQSTSHLVPLSIISPDPYEPDVVGRKFAWGVADPHNADHCDFKSLKAHVFREWRTDLREASREMWYEGWRTSRLNRKQKRQGVSLENGAFNAQVYSGQRGVNGGGGSGGGVNGTGPGVYGLYGLGVNGANGGGSPVKSPHHQASPYTSPQTKHSPQMKYSPQTKQSPQVNAGRMQPNQPWIT